MIMTPALYSPHGLVIPRSHEPLPLALHCCAILRCCWLLALGPYNQRMMRHTAMFCFYRDTRRQESIYDLLPLSLSLQRKSTREQNENEAGLCPGTTIHQQCQLFAIVSTKTISLALPILAFKYISILNSSLIFHNFKATHSTLAVKSKSTAKSSKNAFHQLPSGRWSDHDHNHHRCSAKELESRNVSTVYSCQPDPYKQGYGSGQCHCR